MSSTGATFSAFPCQIAILAAGKGVRMRSELPKVLHRLCGRTLIHRSIAAAAALKPARIVLVLGSSEAEVRREVEQLRGEEFLRGIELSYVTQSPQLGTGHAMQIALDTLRAKNLPVLVMPGDCPLISAAELGELLQIFTESKAKLALLSAIAEDPTGFGRVLREKEGRISGVVEEKDASDAQRKIREMNSSIYVFALDLLEAGLGALKPVNAQGEYYLTDIIDFAVKRKDPVEAVCLPTDDAVLGANTRAELSALETKRRAKINHRWMTAGVTMEDPTSTYIDEDVQIGADCYLGAGTKLRGKTVLGEKVTIDGNSLVVDSTIGDSAHIKLSCVIDSTEIGRDCVVGPFAHLRMNSKLHENVKVGNFVETKKSELFPGVKAMHLSYLGDATVGKNSNIGAGTITVNYDGVDKHRTEIGSDSFVGSNSSLVAPVKIGSGAFVAAGSTITSDVPSGALGIGRGRQENKEGWAAKKKKKKE